MSPDMSNLTPEERRQEIAEILARGFLRLTVERAKETQQLATQGDLTESKGISESRLISLDDGGTSDPHVTG